MTEATADGAAPLSEAADAALAAARDAYRSATAAVTAPVGLVETTMRTVSLDLRPSQRLALPGGVGGFVTDTAVANAIRLVLDGDPAVIARRCRVEPDGERWRVTLTVTVSFAHFDRHGDTAIRDRVVAAVADLFGAVVGVVDIDIVDVFTGAGPGIGAGR